MPKNKHPPSSETVLVGNIPHKVPASKRERSFSPKVKTGCVTCRIRHVKCDEGKPACKRCTSTGRKCDGYISPQVSSDKETPMRRPHQLAPKPHPGPSTRAVIANDRDIRQFDFFRSQTTQQLSGNFDADFWNGVLLQIGHSEPTVWHSILAVASLHEQYMLHESNQNVTVNRRLALDHYNTAIKRLTLPGVETRESVPVILVSCLLFVCLELLLENVKGAMTHVHSGVSILEAWQSNLGTSCGSTSNACLRGSLVEDHIVPIFHRLKIQVATFDSTHLARFTAKMSRNDWEFEAFADLAHARDTLIEIWNAAMRLGETLAGKGFGDSLSDFTVSAMEQAELVIMAKRWSNCFDALLSRPNITSLGPQGRRGVALLRLQHKIASVFISTALSPQYFTSPPPDTVWDVHISDFQSVVTLAESVCSIEDGSKHAASFNFEMGIIIPLYITALKCRHPCIRQRALAILSASQRREGFWDSRMAASMAERLIKAEEDSKEDLGGEMGLLDLPRRSNGEKLTYSQRVLGIQRDSILGEG